MIEEGDCDSTLIIAALLHDSVEDTNTTIKEIESIFGKEVMILVKGMTKVPGKYKKLWGRERYYNEGFFGRLKDASKHDKRIWKLKMSDRYDNMKDYHKFQPVKKIKDFVWETEQFINFARQDGVLTPLMTKLQTQIDSYHKIIKNNISKK